MLPPLTYIVSRLRIRQLRLLIALDELGTLHRAAERIAISQPGATKALHEIETTFGTPLFIRTTQGLQANDMGRCVIRYARLIHNDLAHLHDEMQGILQGHGGHLAVGTIAGSVPLVLRALTRLRQAQPDISVQIVEDVSPRLLKLLDEGRLDLAIARTSGSQHPDAYECLSLHAERLALVAAPQHPQQGNPALNLVDLSAYSWVVYPTGTPMRTVLEREFGEAGLEFPRNPLETSSTFTMLSLLQEDPQLVAVMPHSIASSSEGFGLLRRLPLSLQSRNEPCSIIHRSGTSLSPLATQLLEHLRSEQDALLEDA
ncbi:LysR family transcriptional regulator [Ectopseudomonas alcaliphila]|uniref:LysR family transcriptional regulator n=1 Tax=Ectopseudomonas alcaliphila TaxID=101564 RepID=UPI002784FACD|nr:MULTISPECIES: LysR family transcriptional regulator [Pseudomonas]MDP9938869.1 DNA-binding transcriptional LysR family regulator [Pseudomonas sp. 3400]MDR7011092.1 DNA-binding transcriptional LysR family regulator [Pseudomonas alcaliphila]